MTEETYPEDFLALIRSIANKRAKTVVEHILKHGFITTEELETLYGYKHPPRAARDVREQGVPLETIRVKNTEGRTIAAYRFGDLSQVRKDRLGGRSVFSKQFKASLIEEYRLQCCICAGRYEKRYLQIDHRVPYEVSGDTAGVERHVEDYMLLCGSCNRAKSWSCEHCLNWTEIKSVEICVACYWAHPEAYKHAALRSIRRLDMVWTEDEVAFYDQLKAKAEQSNKPLAVYIKELIQQDLEDD